jgi:phage terminase large subunit GpA-like protein
MTFASALPILRGAAEAFRPPQRVRVSQGAGVMRVHQSKGDASPWSLERTPYMAEPMDMLASRRHEAVVFVGPARTGKTLGLLDGWLAHCIVNDPGDFLAVHMTQDKAREYSKTRIDRMIRHSPEIKARMSRASDDDNTHDKMTGAGMWIRLGWPSATQLSASDYRYTAGTDYDRWPDNIDGEGAGFSLLRKRTQTFLSRGMTMIESSPGRDYEEPGWRPSTPHEAPPCSGILGVYNTSDRRRLYWPCPECGEHFEAAPGLRLFSTLPDEMALMDIVRSADLGALADRHAKVCCPHCACQIDQDRKRAMNARAVWVPDGQSVTADGELCGPAPAASIAGYWLGGVAAAYQRWESILLRYLQGLREYVLTGSDLTLKTTVNTDQGMPYLPRHLAEASGDQAESRLEPLERFHVPEWARFLLAAVDVQGGSHARFVVQVHAIGPDMESAVVDRYDIIDSPTRDARIDPAAYPEDWSALTDRVISCTYRVREGIELRVLHTVVDYGGEAGVSTQAAAWLRSLRAVRLMDRVTLAKGDAALQEFVQRTFARDSRGKRMRDVPLLLFNPDKFKDLISAAMRRNEPGPAFMHFPDWLRQPFFDELRAEVRGPNGKWRKVRARNETLDLWAMIWAGAYALGPADPRRSFDWSSPPPWAAPIERNSLLMTREERRQAQAPPSQPRKQGFRREW